MHVTAKLTKRTLNGLKLNTTLIGNKFKADYRSRNSLCYKERILKNNYYKHLSTKAIILNSL